MNQKGQFTVGDEHEQDGSAEPAAAQSGAPADGAPADHPLAADIDLGHIHADVRSSPGVREAQSAAMPQAGNAAYVGSAFLNATKLASSGSLVDTMKLASASSFLNNVRPSAESSPFLANIRPPLLERSTFLDNVGPSAGHGALSFWDKIEPAARSGWGIASVLKTLESARGPLFEASRAADVVAGFSRNWATRQIPALAKLVSTVEAVRTPLFAAHAQLGETLAGIGWSAEMWQSTMGPASGFVAAMKGLEAMRAPLLGANRVFDGFVGISRGWTAMTNVFSSSDAMRKLTTTLWSGVDHSGFVDRVMRGHTDALVDTLQRWSSWADRGVLAARVALEMALDARAAAKRGDLGAVEQFMRTCLGFRELSIDLVASAVLVLLDVSRWLSDAVLTLKLSPIPLLRRLTLAEHRGQRLILDPDPKRRALRLCGQSLLALDEPVGSQNVPGEDAGTLGERQAGRVHPDPAVIYEQQQIVDPRVLRLWRHFTDRERNILYERGRPGTTWPAAAVACGGTTEEGVALRRKVKRLSKGLTMSEPVVQVVS